MFLAVSPSYYAIIIIIPYCIIPIDYIIMTYRSRVSKELQFSVLTGLLNCQ